MWNDFLKNTLLKPLLEKAGTALGLSILWGGDWLCANWQACGLVSESGVDQVVKWIILAALISFDLVVGWANRRKAEKKAVSRFLASPSKSL